jgi:hypothetical protein
MSDPALGFSEEIQLSRTVFLKSWAATVVEVSRDLIILLKSTICRDIMPCSPLRVHLRFGGKYCLHLQGRKISRERNQNESRWQARWILARLIFIP